MKTGLVISGGGPRGSFAAGALQALADRGIATRYDVVSGTSTGALIAPFAAVSAFGYLSRMYRTTRAKDIYRKRWAPYAALFRPGFYSLKPLRKLLERDLTPELVQRIKAANVLLSTFDLHDARTTYWTTRDMPVSPRWDVDEIRDKAELIDAMIASASIPVVADPVEIDGRRYVDGGVRDHTPLSPVIKLGCDRIYVIVLSPPGISEQQKVKGLKQIAERCITGMSAEVLEGDLAEAERLNGVEGYRTIDFRVIRLTQSFVWGTDWTVEDMEKQWLHGYNTVLEEAKKWS